VKHTHSRASEFFDAYAHDFNAIYGNKHTLFNRMVNNLFRKAMRVRYQKTLEGCQPIQGKTAIDIGCGPGHYSVALARAGAASVFGLDFAESMIDIAAKNADAAGVKDRCRFAYGDFLTYPVEEKFDFAVIMGFMDYIEHPEKVISRVLEITRERAFFSFPMDGGVLAWQRKLRYKSRCELYMYTRPQLQELFARLTDRPVSIERIDRDFFVTVQIA
jgi:2-polyprenyl-3-methyl-5-hydroxy-6-metoxy-1,4-benzoquinol methylase